MRMVLLAVGLLLILLLALASRTRRPGQRPRPAGVDPLVAQLQRWTADGLLSQEQATAILTAECARARRQAAPARPMSIVVELLGYLGGTLAVIGAGLLAARFWPDPASWTRLTLLGLVAVALWAAGALVREHADAALWRLRGVLWLGSSAAVAFFAALLGTEVLELDGEAVALLVGLATATHAGALWRRQPRPLQQLACLAGLAVAAGAGVAVAGGNEAAVGLSVWAVGVLWVLGGWRGLLPPTVVALVAGAIVVLQGAQATAVRWEGAGLLFGLASAAGLLAAGMTGRRLALAVVGIIGVVMFLPATVIYFFAGTVGVPVLILLAGVVLLIVTLVLLRRRQPRAQATPTPARERPEERSSPSDSTSGPRAACLAALVLGPVVATRDEPVNLSDSRSRTHQHFPPAGATCCQSLLLDPDATIGVDLRKRLFLLVTGRGE